MFRDRMGVLMRGDIENSEAVSAYTVTITKEKLLKMRTPVSIHQFSSQIITLMYVRHSDAPLVIKAVSAMSLGEIFLNQTKIQGGRHLSGIRVSPVIGGSLR